MHQVVLDFAVVVTQGVSHFVHQGGEQTGLIAHLFARRWPVELVVAERCWIDEPAVAGV